LFFVHQAINGEHAATEIFNLRLVGCTLGADVIGYFRFSAAICWLISFSQLTSGACRAATRVSSVGFSWFFLWFEFMYPLRRAALRLQDEHSDEAKMAARE
jgi:hypothetical protein